VFGAQTRLIWDIARVYYQRPTLKDGVYLYSNVLSTAFIAGEVSDADVAEQIQPVLGAALGSAAAAIPGLQVASSLFVNSVFSGTANAFLTLRVGIITREYCRALVATASGNTLTGAARAVTDTVAETGTWAKNAGVSAVTQVRGAGSKLADRVTEAGDWVKGASSSVADRLPIPKRTDSVGEQD